MLNGHMYVEDNYSSIYHLMLRDVYHAPNHEVVGMSYCLENPTKTNVENSVRAFDVENAEKFYQWILAGDPNMATMIKATKRAIQFDREVEGRNPHYGPRIGLQVNEVIEELIGNPGTRRACMLILDAKDQIFLKPKREFKNTIEYPCAVMLNYFIRDGYLHAHTVMRSNNMCSTICYDNHNFCRLQEEILSRYNLRAGMLGLSKVYLGYYYHYILNAHIVVGEVKRSRRILGERYGKA